MNKLKELMGGVDPAIRMLKQYKERWIDKFRYKKIKLQKLLREASKRWIMLTLKETIRIFLRR